MMGKVVLLAGAAIVLLTAAMAFPQGVIIDHTCTDLARVPMEYIAAAQNGFRVHYAHRSHGSQITVGLGLIEAWAGAYAVAVESLNLPGETGALCIYTGMPGNDYPYPGDYSDGVQAFLDGHPTVNVSMFSWCDELETWGAAQVNDYLTRMSQLEEANPNVRFIYMTANAQGEIHNRHLRNEQIRNYCRDNGKVLYDFGDLDCWYEGSQHTEGGIPVEHPVYAGDYEGTHVNAASCVNKAKAFWHMMAILAGWQGGVPPGPGPGPGPSGPPLSLRADKEFFSAAYDTITIFATVQPASGFTPYIRIATPTGSHLYIRSGGGLVPGSASGGAPYLRGPLTLGATLTDYTVAAFEFGNIASGTYQLQGALVGGGGIIGGIFSTDLIVEKRAFSPARRGGRGADKIGVGDRLLRRGGPRIADGRMNPPP